ncbi:hypothetical protein PAXRUDRAFT_835589, partial [Paxillus rubicundulus Ve08.2h10]
MRCDESPHGFRAGTATPGRGKAEVRTPGSRESGGTNSGVAGKRRYELRVAGKRSWCSGSGVHCILS